MIKFSWGMSYLPFIISTYARLFFSFCPCNVWLLIRERPDHPLNYSANLIREMKSICEAAGTRNIFQVWKEESLGSRNNFTLRTKESAVASWRALHWENLSWRSRSLSIYLRIRSLLICDSWDFDKSIHEAGNSDQTEAEAFLCLVGTSLGSAVLVNWISAYITGLSKRSTCWDHTPPGRSWPISNYSLEFSI